MLSYRHQFHAGNHGDVLKHIVLTLVIDYMKRKDKPFLYVDTHAGSGMYWLTDEWAQKNREYEAGIERVWLRDDAPPGCALYLDSVRRLNPDGVLKKYPGSPWLALQLLRPGDRARLFDLHPVEAQLLAKHYGREDHVQVEEADGFDGLKSALPPLERRALVLIDPPYEVKDDYRRVVTALREAQGRFATGVYLVWYPLVQPGLVTEMLNGIAALGFGESLRLELCVDTSARQGMATSGVLVLNPPYTLAAQMQGVLPYLVQHLAGPGGGRYLIEARP